MSKANQLGITFSESEMIFQFGDVGVVVSKMHVVRLFLPGVVIDRNNGVITMDTPKPIT